MSRRTTIPIPVVLLLAATVACGSPTEPSAGITVTFPAQVLARRVVCATCTVEPREWAVAEFPVTMRNDSNQGGTLASVEARVTNRSRGGVELGRGVRPNVDHAYSNTHVPAGGSLAVEAGVVFFPVPASDDDVQVDVTVTLTDGREARHSGSVALMAQ